MTIKVTQRWYWQSGNTVYSLSNGWLILKTRTREDGIPWKYALYIRQTCDRGPILLGGADTLKAALAIATEKQQQADANLTRMAFGKG